MWISRAFVYLSQNNYGEAHASFMDVLKMDPKNPVVSLGHTANCIHLAIILSCLLVYLNT